MLLLGESSDRGVEQVFFCGLEFDPETGFRDPGDELLAARFDLGGCSFFELGGIEVHQAADGNAAEDHRAGGDPLRRRRIEIVWAIVVGKFPAAFRQAAGHLDLRLDSHGMIRKLCLGIDLAIRAGEGAILGIEEGSGDEDAGLQLRRHFADQVVAKIILIRPHRRIRGA